MDNFPNFYEHKEGFYLLKAINECKQQEYFQEALSMWITSMSSYWTNQTVHTS